MSIRKYTFDTRGRPMSLKNTLQDSQELQRIMTVV